MGFGSRFFFRGCWSRRCRLGSFFLLQIDDGGGKILFLGQDGKGQGGQHEDDGDDDREFAEEVRRSPAAEDGLARSTESRADFCSLTGLEENRSDHKETGENVDNDEERMHGAPISERVLFQRQRRL